MTTGTVIVGAGQSAFSLAARLRALGYERDIVIVGDEVHPPYQRPPLSKKYLGGAVDAASLQLRPARYFEDQRIELRLGVRATQIDTVARRLSLSDGSGLAYQALVLATGTRARQLPEAVTQGLGGIHALRGADDARSLKSELQAGRHLVVVGGGFVGLEVAATARQLGLEVTVVEQAERILQRVAGAQVSQRLRHLHQSHGVRILEKRRLEALRGANGRVGAVVLDGGEVLPADVVLVGIGAAPNVELAQASGLSERDGIVVDATGMTSAEGVYACGDCARFPTADGGSLRLESVQNAIAMGECVAQSIAGQPGRHAPVPWFWSDQYDCKLQMVGLAAGHDAVVVRDSGDRPTQGASFWYFKGPDLIAVEALNDAAAFVQARRWLEQKLSPVVDELADKSVALKSVSVH